MLMPQAAHGADVRAVTVANNLHPMVAAVGNNKVAVAVKRDAAIARCELPNFCPLLPMVRTWVPSLLLHAVAAVFRYDDVPRDSALPRCPPRSPRATRPRAPRQPAAALALG